MRTERDSLGELRVPEEAYYGVHTCRSQANFGWGGDRLPLELILALVRLKWACAQANRELGELDAERADAIINACRQVLERRYDDQFPLGMYQAGSGTSTNMNVNEVLANRACEMLGARRGDRERVHPNDHVNLGQSTNNIFPSAIRVATVLQTPELLRALRALETALRNKAAEFKTVVKSGRTHLQDAVPVTLGQEFAAWARALEKARGRLRAAGENLLELGVGGNAVGTGINTLKAFRPAIIRALNAQTGAMFRVAEDGLEITQFLTDLAQFSSALRLVALDAQKICNDLRLLASGPNTGFNEIVLPPVEPGSSIMPGKVNPSLCEAVNMVCLQAQGLDHAVQLACGAGQLELNTHMPLVGANLLRMMGLLERALPALAEKCVLGITARRDICAAHFERSAGLATVLNPRLGYDRVAALVKESLRTGKSLRELVLKKRLLKAAEWEALLRGSTRPRDGA